MQFSFSFQRMTRFLMTVTIVALFLMVAGCQCGSENASGKSNNAVDTLTLLSPHSDIVQDEFEIAFKAYYRQKTGRDVEMHWLDVGGGSSDILRWIRSEFANKPNGINVDILFGGGTDPFIELDKEEFLAVHALPQEIDSALARDIGGIPLRNEKGSWYAATMSAFGIMYNKVRLNQQKVPEPKKWSDLADPRYVKLCGSADPSKSGSMHMAYEIILQAYGWENGWKILVPYGANVTTFTEGASTTVNNVAQGVVGLAPAIDYYAWQQIRALGSDNIGFVLPEDAAVVNGDAIAILKGAPNNQLAGLFIDFVLSEAGQKIFYYKQGAPGGPVKNQPGRFSVIPAMYKTAGDHAAVTMNPFESPSEFSYDSVVGGKRYEVVNMLVSSQIIDVHDRLISKWQTGIEQGQTQQTAERLSKMPVSDAEAIALAESGQLADDLQHQEIRIQWASFADSKVK
ncbi:MAG: extracellular solute-binding protein [Planctomycetota bacterium]